MKIKKTTRLVSGMFLVCFALWPLVSRAQEEGATPPPPPPPAPAVKAEEQPVAVPDAAPAAPPAAPAPAPEKAAAPAVEVAAPEKDATPPPPPPQPAAVMTPPVEAAASNATPAVATPPAKPAEVVTPPVEAAASNAAPATVATTNGASDFIAAPEDKKELPKGVSGAEGRIDITLDDVEMSEVIRMFTRITGANIIVTPTNLVGRVTVNLNNVEWKPALTSILKMHNLGLNEDTPGSGVYSIVAKPANAPDPQVLETIFLKYAAVSNILNVIQSMVAAPGTVTPFPSKNALVIRSTDKNLREVRTILKEIDTLREQVFIEAKFMELNDTAIKDLGINWQVLRAYNLTAGADYSYTAEGRRIIGMYDGTDISEEKVNENTYSKTVDPANGDVDEILSIGDTISRAESRLHNKSDQSVKALTDIRTAVLGIDDFRLILSALKQMNGVTVVSNPKIVVANEEPATIHIGQEERPFVASVTAGQNGIAPVVTYNPGAPVQLGVKLVVTPTVNTMSNITVRIEPELTRFIRDAVAPNGQTYPIIGTKKITTSFCLESGKTVAIGGLTENQENDVTTKIPLLGDIPLIGKYLFSHTHTEKNQQETIIFVTVGLAVPESIQAVDGLPEDAELVQRKMAEQRLRRHRYEVEEAKRKAELEGEITADKTKSRLLKITN